MSPPQVKDNTTDAAVSTHKVIENYEGTELCASNLLDATNVTRSTKFC